MIVDDRLQLRQSVNAAWRRYEWTSRSAVAEEGASEERTRLRPHAATIASKGSDDATAPRAVTRARIVEARRASPSTLVLVHPSLRLGERLHASACAEEAERGPASGPFLCSARDAHSIRFTRQQQQQCSSSTLEHTQHTCAVDPDDTPSDSRSLAPALTSLLRPSASPHRRSTMRASAWLVIVLLLAWIAYTSADCRSCCSPEGSSSTQHTRCSAASIAARSMHSLLSLLCVFRLMLSCIQVSRGDLLRCSAWSVQISSSNQSRRSIESATRSLESFISPRLLLLASLGRPFCCPRDASCTRKSGNRYACSFSTGSGKSGDSQWKRREGNAGSKGSPSASKLKAD